MGEIRNAYSILVRKLEGKSHLEDLSIDGRIMLQWISEKQSGMLWTGFIWLRTRTSGRLL
jgi:hypothetical protein